MILKKKLKMNGILLPYYGNKNEKIHRNIFKLGRNCYHNFLTIEANDKNEHMTKIW